MNLPSNIPENAQKDPKALEAQGDQLYKQRQFPQALDCYVNSQKLNTSNPSIYLKLGRAYLAVRDPHQAKTALTLLLNSGNPPQEAKALYAETLLSFGEIDQACEIIENLLAGILTKRERLICYNTYLKILIDKDDTEKIAEVSKQALEIWPNEYFYLRTLAKYQKLFDEDKDLLEKYSSIADKTKGVNNFNEDLFYGLAEAYSKLGDYKKSVKYLKRANAIFGSRNKFNLAEHTEATNACLNIFDKALYQARQTSGDRESTPIFIIGMPRSATSLTEQILSSHSKVSGCGELMALAEISKDITKAPNFKVLPDEQFSHYAKLYLDVAKQVSGHEEGQIITDKMPTNYFYLGFTALLFPNAKIIHCVRDLRDVAISNYSQKFLTGNQFANNMQDIVSASGLYKQLMDHWKEVLPIEIYDFNYQDLLNNPEEEVRKLIAHCDLEWEDGCLNYHKNKRVMHTASKAQVTKKLFKSSLDKWKNYEPFFPKELAKLGELNW